MKTRKFLRSAAATLIAGAMLAGTGVSAEGEISAGDSSNHVITQTAENVTSASIAGNFESEIREYVNGEIPQHLAGLGYYGSFTMSDIIPIHNWDGADLQKYLVVVSDNGKMIGSLTVEYINGKFVSLFREENISELNEAITNNVPFQLGYSSDCFMISTADGISVIDNPEFVDTDFTASLTVSGALNESTAYSRSVTAAGRARVATYQVSPTVQNVSNATHPDDSKHALCWAACVASVGMQYTSATGHTALTVYNACKNSTSSDKPTGDPYPIGEIDWYLFALDEIYGISAMYKSALSSNQVQNLLLANRPIIVRLRNSTDSKRKHGMVLFMYYYLSSTSGQYIFMDPGSSGNGAGRVSVMIDSTVMNNGSGLTIASRNGYTYDIWYQSIYRK